jgi:RHS repeat-associated protein
VVENVYDVDGVLVRMAVNGVATDLLVDTSGGLSHVVAEIDGSGAVTAVYVRADDMLLEEIRGGVARMYEADALGSTRSLLDTTGTQTDTWSYEAFGSIVSTTGNDLNPYRFAGERLVDSVGLYQNRARWLDTTTGRFASVDPGRGNPVLPLTSNHYVYGLGSPASLRDPTGWETVFEAIQPSIMAASLESSFNLASPSTQGVVRWRPPTGEELKADPGVRSALIGAMFDSWAGIAIRLQNCDDAWGAFNPCVVHQPGTEEGGWIYASPNARKLLKFERESRPSKKKDAGIDLRDPRILHDFFVVGDFHTHPKGPEGWKQQPSGPDERSQEYCGVPGIILSANLQYYAYGPERRRGGWAGGPGYPPPPP